MNCVEAQPGKASMMARVRQGELFLFPVVFCLLSGEL
jgi:hypothetical protein